MIREVLKLKGFSEDQIDKLMDKYIKKEANFIQEKIIEAIADLDNVIDTHRKDLEK